MASDGAVAWDEMGCDLDEYAAEQPTVVKESMADASLLMRAMRSLVELRKERKLRQKDIARIMGTTQSAVSDLENFRVDPQVSTLFRYARATGGQVRLMVTVTPTATDARAWEDALPRTLAPVARVRPGSAPRVSSLANAWLKSASLLARNHPVYFHTRT